MKKSNRKEKSFSPNSACYTNKPTNDASRMATCNQKCTSLNNKRVQMTVGKFLTRNKIPNSRVISH